MASIFSSDSAFHALSLKSTQFWISSFFPPLAGILSSCHDDRDVLLLKSCLLTVQSDHGAQTAAGTGEDAPIPAAQCIAKDRLVQDHQRTAGHRGG